MTAGVLRTPKKRVCEHCGREEVWNEEVDSWRIRRVDGERRAGSPFCIHEWDINGTFVPIDKDA